MSLRVDDFVSIPLINVCPFISIYIYLVLLMHIKFQILNNIIYDCMHQLILLKVINSLVMHCLVTCYLHVH